MISQVKDDLQTLLLQVEEKLQSLLQTLSVNEPPLLLEAASYCLLNPGKRIRPLLTLCVTQALGGSIEEALIPACAIEILHTYSLIHDDLPCMDDDDLRRGKPTLHKVYPEGQAVLVGDLLLTMAFEALAVNPLLDSKKSLELVRILAQKSGGKGMILGQSLDLAYEGKSLLWEQVQEIHQRKTGDLISASLEFGALVAGASAETQQILSGVGQKIGLSFQIIDDLLDLEGEPHLLGKPLHSDLVKQKNTSVSLLGKDLARELAERLLLESLQQCEALGLQDTLFFHFLPNLKRK